MAGKLSTYTLCAGDFPPDLECDAGVKSAVSDEDGDLLAAGAVTACSNSSTLAKAGLAACSTVVNLNVPGEYTVEFGVWDSQVCTAFILLSCFSWWPRGQFRCVEAPAACIFPLYGGFCMAPIAAAVVIFSQCAFQCRAPFHGLWR
jgi:hypothetical protein